MKDRIRKIRKLLNLTQQEFAKNIGSTQNVLANYEIGRRNPSNSVINNICKTFNVNEEWLRTGMGEIFKPTSQSELNALAEKYQLSKEATILIEKFIKLKREQQDAIIEFVKETASKLDSLPSNISATEENDF